VRKLREEPVGVEAAKLVHGDRQETYGDPIEMLEKIAKGWEAIAGVPLTARQVSHMMIWLKVARDTNKAHRDNEVDICGYAHLLQFERESQPEEPAPAEAPKPKRKRRTKAEMEAARAAEAERQAESLRHHQAAAPADEPTD